jgi:hypothetical protein
VPSQNAASGLKSSITTKASPEIPSYKRIAPYLCLFVFEWISASKCLWVKFSAWFLIGYQGGQTEHTTRISNLFLFFLI